MQRASRRRRALLRVWRDVPFPGWLRRVFLRLLNPSFMVGAMALVQDERGHVLILEHTYRRDFPWGLPGGWLHRGESPEQGLVREVGEETGISVSVEALLAAEFFDDVQIDLLFRCAPVSGSYHATDETSHARWVALTDLPPLLMNQETMLRKAHLLPETTSS